MAILFDPNRTELGETHQYGTTVLLVWLRIFWIIQDSRLFSMAELYRFLTSTIRYVPNRAVRYGLENPDWDY